MPGIWGAFMNAFGISEQSFYILQFSSILPLKKYNRPLSLKPTEIQSLKLFNYTTAKQ